MKLKKIFLVILGVSFVLFSCEDLLDSKYDNHNTFESVYDYPSYAEGLLITAYTKLPRNNLSDLDVATDDAVTNNKLSNYLRMATGEWSAKFNPLNQWSNYLEGIIYINRFLEEVVDSVAWKWTDDEINGLYVKRFKGEAYTLRALYQYQLLVTVGGVGQNGEWLGIPIYTSFPKTEEEFNKPRSSFNESVAKIYADIDKALEYLTMDEYSDISSEEDLPEGYENVDITKYNDVFGIEASQRVNGRFAKALRAKVALLAASPAFSDGNETLWANAANYAAEVLERIGGVNGLDPEGHKFFVSSVISKVNLLGGSDQAEIILRSSITNTNTREVNNFPPSLFGSGRINPSQNLVDAFPMANGYPITHSSSGYDAANPYANRDPRLSIYIVYNGSTMKGKVIGTGMGGGVNAKDSLSTSTRTGYYLRKFLREDVSADPSSSTTQKHYEAYMRYTELFLIYAEAANEAWGPDGKGGNSISAREVIAAIRERAGISQPDNYLVSISGKEDMRKLIRNERRLELCFEGFRFWDLRRWQEDLTEAAKGVNISQGQFSYIDIEKRSYDNSYMHSGPLPYTELLKFGALIQNKGW